MAYGNGRVDLRNGNDRSRFFEKACRNGKATISSSEGGARTVVWAQRVPGSTKWVACKDGSTKRIRESGDHYVYSAQVIYGSGAKGPVCQGRDASGITQWMMDNDAPLTGMVDGASASSSAGSAGDSGDYMMPIFLLIGAISVGSGIFLNWVSPILENVFLMIGNVLSVVLKLGLVAGVACFAVWLWRAAGPLPGDTPRG